MSEDLTELCRRRDELEAAVHGRKRCTGRVADCPNATTLIKVPNHYDVQRFGPWNYCKFCPACVRKSTAINKLVSEEEKKTAVLYDPKQVQKMDERRTQDCNELSSIRNRIYELQKDAETADFWARYDAHLKSEAWRQKRRAVIARCGNVCEGCGNNPVAHVHHLTYAHLGNELLFELVGVCVDCHATCHPERFENQEVEF